MKILRIIARLNVGGPARHVVWLTDELRDDEFQTTLIAGRVPKSEGDMSYLARERNIEPIFVEEMSRELSPMDVISLWKVWRIMVATKPDLVHTHTAKAGAVGRAAAFLYRWLTLATFAGRPRKVIVVHTFHGHVFHSYYGKLKTKIFIYIEKMLAVLVTDKIVVISPQQLSEICDDVGIGRAEQFELIRLGIDLEPFTDSEVERQAFRTEISAREDDFVIGFVGRLTEIKNIPLFLNAIALFMQRAASPEQNVRFLIVGDGHLRSDLERETVRLGIAEGVSFLGNRNDLARVYAGLDAVALMSFNEGTPLSLIEAMASNKPVISTAVGGVNDLLGDVSEIKNGFEIHERGISVVSNSAESYYDGLKYLVGNDEFRKTSAQKGKTYVVANYSKQNLVANIKEFYRRLSRS